jgi:adenosylhomocysteine nucleosidase
MPLRSLLQIWLQNAAKGKLRDALAQTARERLSQTSGNLLRAEEPRSCHLGLVFALGIESGCLEDLLQGKITIRGNGFVVREGGLGGRRVVVILSGAGRQHASRATEVLIDGHRPGRVISAGFAGALTPELKRNDILIADQLIDASDTELSPAVAPDDATSGRGFVVEVPAGLSAMLSRPGVHRGALLTTDRVVRWPRDKLFLFHRFGAMAVDMETVAVAEVCRRRGVPFSSIRVINDTADEVLPRDVEHLLAQKTSAAQFGAALGAVWRRPASLKDMYQLRENALVASLRLAGFLVDASLD